MRNVISSEIRNLEIGLQIEGQDTDAAQHHLL